MAYHSFSDNFMENNQILKIRTDAKNILKLFHMASYCVAIVLPGNLKNKEWVVAGNLKQPICHCMRLEF